MINKKILEIVQSNHSELVYKHSPFLKTLNWLKYVKEMSRRTKNLVNNEDDFLQVMDDVLFVFNTREQSFSTSHHKAISDIKTFKRVYYVSE